MNYKNGKTSETHVLILTLTDKLDLRRCEKSTDSSNTHEKHERLIQ